MIENKRYFIDQINSSKAYQFTSAWHYSGVGFKKAILNLGVFRKEDNLLVGVLQWGCSFQEKIKLDRYVKEPIEKSEYLELNRFCMADSEGKNSESQAISLGIKWIKKYRPNVRLLVSYSGRKEGNYGYIYQATNWEYLGYFISEGFWLLDGQERHLTTLWYLYKHNCPESIPFTDGICSLYSDVRKTWTKQFIYILRLDKTLTPASDILEYPKPSNEYPICTKIKIYKQNDDVFNNYSIEHRKPPMYYYTPNERLFTLRTLQRRGEYIGNPKGFIAVYNAGGELESTYKTVKDIQLGGFKTTGIQKALREKTHYKSKYFLYYTDEPLEEIEVPFICIIDEIPFDSFSEAGRYLGVSRQAVHQAKKRKSTQINGSKIEWFD